MASRYDINIRDLFSVLSSAGRVVFSEFDGEDFGVDGGVKVAPKSST